MIRRLFARIKRGLRNLYDKVTGRTRQRRAEQQYHRSRRVEFSRMAAA